jgi:RHS repeat-associated protein
VIGDTTFVTYDSTFRRRPVQAALPLVRDPVSGVYTAPIVQYTAYERRGVGALVPLDSTWVMITDARGFWSKSLPNRWGQSVRSWDQKGLLGRAAYDPDGFLLWSEGKTADSSRTYHVYDAHRRPVKSYIVRTASDTLRGDSLVYDANHRVVQVIDNRNKTTTTTWDGLGNVIGVKDPNGDSTRTWYLTNGLVDSIKLPGPTPAYRRVRYETVWKQVASTIDPGGDTTGWTWYDALGRAEIGRARLKGDSLAGFRWAQSQTWYGSDNSIDSTATFRASTSSGFAPPTSWPALTDTLNTRRADFRYDRAGRDSLRLNNRGKGPRYAFDRLGRLTHRWPWAEVTTVYDSMRYDLTGNVVGVRTRRGHWITTAFDSRNRDSVRVIPGVGTEVKTYGGPLDQLTGWEITSYVDPIGGLNPKRTWAWDQRGRLLSETSYPTGTARTLSYAYDDKERPFQVTDPLGTWTTEYEANRGMPIKLKTPLGDTLTYTWDARGRPGGLQVASGGTRLNITHTWNGSGALDQRHITWLPTSQTVGKWTRLAAADANPAIATRWHEWKTGSTLDSITAYPVYDGWERLIQWDQIHGAQGDETYAFDRTGNLAPHDESSVTFDPVRDRMLTRGAWTYTYDHGGNLVTATDGSESWEYGYDPLNRLVSARRNSALIARYAYDVTGRRMAKRVYSSASGGTEAYTAFVYRGANVAFDTDSAGTIRWKYVWGAGTDDLVGFQDAAGNHYYAVTDQLGSVRNVLTRSGAWRMRLRYRPYGQHMDSSGAGVALRYRWTGREWDGELKMYFHRARHYDPAMNRFVQEDPIGQAGGENLYAYVGGSPLEATDPSGTEAVFLEKGPGGCAPNCFERGVYLDGIYVKNGFWLAGLPGIGTSIGGRLIDDAWATQGYDYEEYKRGYANAIEDRAANSDDDDTRFMVHDAAMLTSGQFFDLLRALNGRGLLRHGASAHLAAGQVFRMSDIATDYFLGVLGKGFNALSSTVEPITGLPGRFWNLKDVERAHELTHEWVHVYHAIYDECEADMVAAANSRYRGFIAHRCRPNR